MVDMNMKVVEPRKLTPESRFRFRCHPACPASPNAAVKPLSSLPLTISCA